MRAKLFSALMVAGVMAGAVAANAQVAISQDGRPEKMAAIKLVKGLNNSDMKMLQTIYWGNAFEIKISEIAVNRAQSMWAKEYAKEMIQEHTMAQNEVKMLAQDKGVSLNNNLPRDLVNVLSRLQNASSSSFDNMYRAAAMSSHSQASAVLTRAIKFGHDEQVRGLAIKMLPAVKDHYALAQIRQTMMGMTKTKTGV
jgi:putative membrane protein